MINNTSSIPKHTTPMLLQLFKPRLKKLSRNIVPYNIPTSRENIIGRINWNRLYRLMASILPLIKE